MKAEDYLEKEVRVFYKRWKGDKEYISDQVLISRGRVVGVEPNSKTLVIVEDIDRGKGWCKDTGKYIGVSNGNGWYLGKNNCFGMKTTVHIKQLEILE